MVSSTQVSKPPTNPGNWKRDLNLEQSLGMLNMLWFLDKIRRQKFRAYCMFRILLAIYNSLVSLLRKVLKDGFQDLVCFNECFHIMS